MLAPWAGAYIGVPYKAGGRDRAGVDCWGLVRLVFAEVYGLELPAYAGGYDLAAGRSGWPAISAAIDAGLADWHPVALEDARIGDGLVLRIGGHPLHVAILAGTRPLRMLHCEEHLATVLEPLDSLMWRRRLTGVYRCRPRS